MKYYTETIPVTLAEKLKEKGMPITMSHHLYQPEPDVRGLVMANFKEIDCPTYGACFDWLVEKGIYISMLYLGNLQRRKPCYEAYMNWDNTNKEKTYAKMTWYSAANTAIAKALTLI